MLENLKSRQGELAQELGRIRRAARECGETAIAERSAALAKAVTDQAFLVALVGEFKAGKSTLANALLGDDVLPTATRECSPAVARVRSLRAGESPGARIRREDGSEEEVSLCDLDEHLRLPLDPEGAVNGVEEAEIRVDGCPLLADGVQLVDTPGVFAAGLARERATLEFLPRADAVVFLTRADQLLPESEVRFLKERVLDEERARLFLVINRSDEIGSEAERQDLTARVQELLGGLPPERRTYFLSAADAVDSIEDDDQEALAESGVPAFLEALSSFLRDDRAEALATMQQRRVDALKTELVRRILARLHNSELDDRMAVRRRERLAQMIVHTREDGERLVAELRTAVHGRLQPALAEETRRRVNGFEVALASEGDAALDRRAAATLAESHGGQALSGLQAILRRELSTLQANAASRLQELFEAVDAELSGGASVMVSPRLDFGDLVVVRTEQSVDRKPVARPRPNQDAPVGATVGAALGFAVFGPLGGIAGAALGAWLVGNEDVRDAGAAFVEEVRSRRVVDVRTSRNRLRAELEQAAQTASELAEGRLVGDVRGVVAGRLRELQRALEELEAGGIEASRRPVFEAALLELGAQARGALPAP